ncbi:MAG TPA: hypothetical protein VN026_03795 [Bacteroidia bacterium]|jgi:hypothetical protein|nr:hypothetical protein [Bacteroidia bacterium]
MMRVLHIRFIFNLLLLSFGSKSFAQQSSLKLLDCKSDVLTGKEKPILFFSTFQYHSVQTDFSLKQLNTARRPMFCRMEDDLHKRFNVWIVLRAGSDADYKKLIEPQK